MKPITFLRLQMSESDGSPSNNRVMLFLLLTTVVLIVVGAALSSNLSIKIVIPIIPDSFATFIEWMAGILVGGSAVGKAANAYSEARAGASVTTKSVVERKEVSDVIPPGNQ